MDPVALAAVAALGAAALLLAVGLQRRGASGAVTGRATGERTIEPLAAVESRLRG